jgi:NTE family protein
MPTNKMTLTGVHRSLNTAGGTALVLPGGGARGAYQVGVLKAISELLPIRAPSPFSVISGTSAGAINAASLASHADRFAAGVGALEAVWRGFSANQVYHTSPLAMLRTSLHWTASLLFGGLGRYNPSSLLDNAPLRNLLRERMALERIAKNIDAGHLKAVAITASSYRSGRSITFFQGHPGLMGWNRTRRQGNPSAITVEHLMASVAVPMIFPAIRVGQEYFGDGAIRQSTPLSPAIHLGSSRALVIAVRDERKQDEPVDNPDRRQPALGQIAGYMLDTIFMDGLYSDLERITRINLLLEQVAAEERRGATAKLRRVETLLILPSRDIRLIAEEYAHQLPRAVRALLRGVGAYGKGGGQLVSYLLFEKGFTEALIKLGHDDAMARKEHILSLLAGEPMPALDAPAEVAGDISGEQESGQTQEGQETDYVRNRGEHDTAGEGGVDPDSL